VWLARCDQVIYISKIIISRATVGIRDKEKNGQKKAKGYKIDFRCTFSFPICTRSLSTERQAACLEHRSGHDPQKSPKCTCKPDIAIQIRTHDLVNTRKAIWPLCHGDSLTKIIGQKNKEACRCDLEHGTQVFTGQNII